MKYLAALVLLIAAACSPIVVDTRDAATAHATQTAISRAPVSGLGGTLRIRVHVPPVTIEPAVVPTATPEPTACEPVVKGNISQDGRKLYHLPGMRNYQQVKIDEAKGERVFCDEQSAIDAGWSKAGQ